MFDCDCDEDAQGYKEYGFVFDSFHFLKKTHMVLPFLDMVRHLS